MFKLTLSIYKNYCIPILFYVCFIGIFYLCQVSCPSSVNRQSKIDPVFVLLPINIQYCYIGYSYLYTHIFVTIILITIKKRLKITYY